MTGDAVDGLEHAERRPPVLAVVQPGATMTRVEVTCDGVLLAAVSGTGGVDGVPALLRLVAASFDVDGWLIGVSGFQGGVLRDPGVVETCERLGITLVAMAPSTAGR